MGFVHRVYKTDDPRSTFLRGVAERIGAEKIDFAKAVERTVVEVLAELKPGRNLYTNVEFYAGVVMDHCGLPRERSEEHTSELQSLMRISYAVFCLKKKNKPKHSKLSSIAQKCQ